MDWCSCVKLQLLDSVAAVLAAVKTEEGMLVFGHVALHIACVFMAECYWISTCARGQQCMRLVWSNQKMCCCCVVAIQQSSQQSYYCCLCCVRDCDSTVAG
jgi:hypothetical protein